MSPADPFVPDDPNGIFDHFSTAAAPGEVLGSSSSSGHRRLGSDPEATLSIDDGALRIAPLEKPGWGRSSVGYGPVTAEPGLLLVGHVLNGHHASQSYELRRLLPRLRQWLQGSGTVPVRGRRILRLLTDGRRLSGVRRIRGWARMTGTADSPLALRIPPLARHRRKSGHRPRITDNLVFGFLTSPTASGPDDLRAGFVVRSASNLHGELNVLVDGRLTPVADRMTAIPVHLGVLCRDDSTLYLVSSLRGSRIGPEYPRFRAVAVGPALTGTLAHAAVQQNTSGEIGFSVDTRVFDVALSHLPSGESWHHGAHVAAELTAGALPDLDPVAGPPWTMAETTTTSAFSATIDPGLPSGLLRLRVTDGAPLAALFWRASGADHLRLELRHEQWQLHHRVDGQDQQLDEGLLPADNRSIQVLDDGHQLRVLCDGLVLTVTDRPLVPTGTGLGLTALGDGPLGIDRFEAHPEAIDLPPSLVGPGATDLRSEGDIVVEDRFETDVATTLEGRPREPLGRWERSLGSGRLVVTEEHGVLIEECTDRTALTLPWVDPSFADLTTTIVPSGGDGARCRAGLIAMQDDDNYIAINLWFNDRPDGAASVSSFTTLDGHEDVYDAVWVNVERRVRWDRPVDLRLTFDGRLYQVALDGEPVLWRRVQDIYPEATRLRIERVGLLANWEWGFDTGSRFERFVGRLPAASGTQPSAGNTR